MKAKTGLKKREAIVSAVAVVVIASLLTTVVFFSTNPSEVREVRMHLKVANYTGFNLDTDALYFGAIAPTGSGDRDLVLINDDSRDKSVRIFMEGELSSWVYPAKNNFILEGSSNMTLGFHVAVPKDASFGEYEGIIRVVLIPV
jgi:hypothetical protein